MERQIELLRQGFARQKNWDIQEHYAVIPSFRLPQDFEQRYRGAWLEVSGGNIVLPNMLRLKVNGRILDLWPEGAFSSVKEWTRNRAWEYKFRVRIPSAMLRAGRNSVRVSTHQLPGLEKDLEDPSAGFGFALELRAQNISVAGLVLDMVER